MIWQIAGWVSIIAIGVAAYYIIDYLPVEWQNWLAGKKTMIISGAAVILPEIVYWITQIHSLGLFEYIPGEWSKLAMQAIGVLTLVMRLRTAKEQGV